VRRRLLIPLGLAVTGLLVLAAVASRGRPLGGGAAGPGPGRGFFDYVFTTLVLVGAAIAVVFVWVLVAERPDRRTTPPVRQRYLGVLVTFLGAVAIAWFLAHDHTFLRRMAQLEQQAQTTQQQQRAAPGRKAVPPGGRGARIRWDEVGLVVALLAGAAVVALAARSRGRPRPTLRRRERQEALSAALDESLDDLLADPDLRRAIIAAYARMERALAGAGLARRPAEAPFEYLERALLELETSAGAVRRLTDLFEWAKFSQHEPEAEMRDEAVAALVAVRDELRAAAPEPVAGASS
jgi:hypothetical protein